MLVPVYKDDTDTRPYCLLILCRTVPIVWKEMDNVKRAENFRKGRIQHLADTGLFCSPLPVLACCADDCAYIIRKQKGRLILSLMPVSPLHGLCIGRDVWLGWLDGCLSGWACTLWGYLSEWWKLFWAFLGIMPETSKKGMVMRRMGFQTDGTGTVPKF